MRKRIYRYLDVLSADISYNIITNTGELQPNMGDSNWLTKRHLEKRENQQIHLEISERKLIWRKAYTETYFLWRPPCSAYSDELFDTFLTSLKNLTAEEAKLNRFSIEVNKTTNEGKLSNFLSLIRRNVDTIFEQKLGELFLKGLSKARYQNELTREFVRTILDIVRLYPKTERLDKLLISINNTENPAFLSLLFEEAEIRDRSANCFNEGDFKKRIPKQIENRYDKIMGQELTCFCEFGIDLNRILFLLKWGSPEKVAQYLQKIENKHPKCAEILISHIEEASSSYGFFKDVLSIYKEKEKGKANKSRK